MLDLPEKGLFSKREPRTAYDIVRTGQVEIPAADAGLILRELRYERQTRDLTAAGKTHIGVLADLMRRRQWRDWDKIDFARVDGRLIIINGHHRLSAQMMSGSHVRWTFIVHECSSMDEVAALYYTFDTNDRPRTTEHILSVIGAAEMLGVTKTTAKAIYNAVPLIIADFDFGRSADDALIRRMADLRMQKVKALQREGVAWERATSKAKKDVKRRLMTQGALAVALICLKHQPGDAEEFWRGVAEDDGLLTGDPRKTYLNSLRDPSGGGTAYTLATRASLAWNAWFASPRKSLKILKIDANAKFRIAGTPIGR